MGYNLTLVVGEQAKAGVSTSLMLMKKAPDGSSSVSVIVHQEKLGLEWH